MPAPAAHTPVLLREVLRSIGPRDGAVYVDGTFGAGGTSRALLEAAECRVWALDRDPAAIARGGALAARYSGRLDLILGRFGDMDRLLLARGIARIDGVALDLGVSTPQLDDPARGFSFRADGPLDMRMGADGPAAAELVNRLSEAELARLIGSYGEERHAGRVARAIVAARRLRPIARTLELAEIVRGAVRGPAAGIDPATRTFQALRIYVNDEIGELRRGLAAAERLLGPGGRLAVVSFHSLEDREVKNFFRARSDAPSPGSRHLPGPAGSTRRPSFRLVERRAIRPSAEETALNPRARSARLRVGARTAAPAWPGEGEGHAGGAP
ncbi:MAG: 16S rRNA (cytosine(1402)-N(4))-methyltransferase RsmH [Pseudomonadota bacterium]